MTTCVISSPPAKKPTTAITEGSWNVARPEMAWPDVHPPAQREPNPTRNPPAPNVSQPRAEVSACHPITSCGTSPERS